MKALIIGAAGFVGGYLTDYLQEQCKLSVVVTKLQHEVLESISAEVFNLDILCQEEIVKLLKTVQPDVIFHLAAQSSVALSWKNPSLTIDVNVKGAVNLLEAARTLSYKPRMLLIGSGEEYGSTQMEMNSIAEDTLLRPGNIYAATKACQSMLGKIYADAYGLDVMMVRAFNHIGPGQASLFVVSDFCKQVAEIEAGIREPIIYVGNLAAKRDFTDVRDVVRAYALLVSHGVAGELYNVGSGKALAIQAILDIIMTLSNAHISIQIDSQKFRPIDVPMIEANIKKLQSCTNWKPSVPLADTLLDVLEFWRIQVRQGQE